MRRIGLNVTQRASRIASLVAPAALGAGVLFAATSVEAKPNVKRKGGQWGLTVGGSACIPGKAKCSRSDILEGGITIDGDSQPSFGMAAELGYRINKFVFLGASYNFGLFNTQYEIVGGEGFKRGYQHSVYGMVRPILPVWRLDLGVGLGPGFSRQVYVLDNGDKDYTQGFSFVVAPTVDIYVSKSVFLGVKADILLNAHNKTCTKSGDTTTCIDGRNTLGPVHQTIFGLHVGGVFP